MISKVNAEGVLDRESRLAWMIWCGVALISLGIIGLIFAAPLAQAHGNPQLASPIYQTFSFVCHQIPQRSFHIAGNKLAVCSRCMGLYAGFAVAVLAYPFARPLTRTDTPSRVWLILAALPLAIDFGLGYFSLWENTHLSRFVTGALLSSVAVFYVMPGLTELTATIRQFFDRNPRRSRLQ